MTASEFYQKFQRVQKHATKKEEGENKTIYTDPFGNQAIVYHNPSPYNLGLFYNEKLYHIRSKRY